MRASVRTGVNSVQHTYRTYDRQGCVVHEVNALNHVTRYTYTSFGDAETVTRYSVTISGAPANDMYWVAAEVDPQLNWGYDENGNLLPDAVRTHDHHGVRQVGPQGLGDAAERHLLLDAYTGRCRPGQLLPT